jgi:hypothetical protein
MRCTIWLVVIIICLAFAVSARAQTGSALLLKPLLSEDENLESRGDALFLGSATASDEGSEADFDMSVFEASGRFRERRENFIPRIGWDLTWYNLRSDTPVLDQDLVDTSIAIGLDVGEHSGWRGGLTVGMGYGGNAPFGESSAYYAKATLVLGKQLDKQTDLGFVLDYDGNRTVFPDVPIPGIAYRHEYDPKLNYTIGVPLSSVTWKPDKPILVEITWEMVDRVDARVEYELSPAWIVFGNFERRQEAFSVDNVGENDRLLFQGRRVEAGVRWRPWEHTSFLLAGGYAFNQEFSVGFDQRKSDKVADISDEPYVRLGFERRW